MKLMERVKASLRVKRYSFRTEKTYCYWIRFHNLRHTALNLPPCISPTRSLDSAN
ncbi:hypothetical protein P8S55_06730 [Halomonas sp. M1]|uniref:hypothetical protein n=1 Tax=Halomonas sp. M1 TaxID=3035470 RepID=UPI0024850B77|nr:hypothetical protein [Halomonas sp. M1]WFE72783.1 hypothetical protein P8S55_06730 [Halomonas sp. M1]